MTLTVTEKDQAATEKDQAGEQRGVVVSVPCFACERPVGFGMGACAWCGAATTRDLERILDERLEAVGGAFSVMRRRIREAAGWLVFLGLVRSPGLVLAPMGYWRWPSPATLVLTGVLWVASSAGRSLSPEDHRRGVRDFEARLWSVHSRGQRPRGGR
jgi:hypothetical protein